MQTYPSPQRVRKAEPFRMERIQFSAPARVCLAHLVVVRVLLTPNTEIHKLVPRAAGSSTPKTLTNRGCPRPCCKSPPPTSPPPPRRRRTRPRSSCSGSPPRTGCMHRVRYGGDECKEMERPNVKQTGKRDRWDVGHKREEEKNTW